MKKQQIGEKFILNLIADLKTVLHYENKPEFPSMVKALMENENFKSFMLVNDNRYGSFTLEELQQGVNGDNHIFTYNLLDELWLSLEDDYEEMEQ